MTFDPNRLLAYDIPEVRQVFGGKEVAFYALSVGMGQDPTDEDQLRYVDHRRALVALPSFAVVLGYPGFWLADPASGVDPRSVLHGEQEIEIGTALPVSGSIVAKTRITGLVDKGPGRGALLYTDKRIVEEASGAVLATTASTIFLRGCGGFGGASGPQRPLHQVPAREPDFLVDLKTRPEQALFYRLNGDDNPLHSDPRAAAASGFRRPILHGLCTFGVICHALVRALAGYDAGRLRGMRLRFSSPVYPGETIRTEMWRDGSFQARVLERDGLVATNGLATVRPEPDLRRMP